MMLRFMRNDTGAALIEAAIALPFFLILMVGIIDLGTGMYDAMSVNAAAQAGAAYAVLNKGATSGSSLLNAAAENLSIYPDVTQSVSVGVVTVTASYTFTPLMWSTGLAALLPWLPKTMLITATATIRIE
jgi:Flp pilus assembly protein TadG